MSIIIIIFIVGAMAGSFLNVVIYRYPIMLEREWRKDCLALLKKPESENAAAFNLCVPRSHCPQCKTKIPFWHNIPIISFLLLRGQCFQCHAKISWQYFLVEVITAMLSVLVYLKLGLSDQAAVLLIFTWGLIALSFIDFNHQFLPDPITYFLLWLGLLISTQHFFINPTQAIFGALIGYLFLYLIAKGYILLKKKEGMGLGDCKMLAMVGAWVGALSLLNVLLCATFLALMAAIFFIALKKIQKTNPIPFGPFIAIGGFCTALYGTQLMQWIAQWVQ